MSPMLRTMRRAVRCFDDLAHDVRYGLRGLARDRGFTIAAVLVLAVGIGLNLSFFHVISATLQTRLPVADAETLLRVVRQSPERERWAFTMESVNFYREHTSLLAYIVGERIGATPVQLERDEQDARAKFVSGDYFDALGVVPVAGRVFTRSDERGPIVAVLSEGYWHRRFAGDPRILAQSVTVNGNRVVITGVLPAEFAGVAMSRGDIWFSDGARPSLLGGPSDGARAEPADVAVIAQPREGVSVEQVSAQIAALTDELRRRQPRLLDERDAVRARAVADDEQRGGGMPIMVALVLLVLLTACANLGNMLLARGLARHREIATRIAVGASRARLVRQLMTESVLLSVLGAVAGLGVSIVGSQLLATRFPGQPEVRVTLDLPVVVAAAALACICAMAFGLAPARHISRLDPRATRSRQTLVAVQVAASCVLLILAGLLSRGAERQLELAGRADYRSFVVIEPRFEDEKLPATAVRTGIDAMAERIAALPEVAATAVAQDPVFSPELLRTDDVPVLLQLRVDPQYFPAMQIGRLRGRLFERGERNVVVISRAAARAAFDDEDPLGQIWNPSGAAVGATIIGIVEDTTVATLRDSRAVEAYLPLDEDRIGDAAVIVRAHGDARDILRLARDAAALPGAAPSAWLLQQPVDQLLQHSVMAAQMIGALGATAAALAAFGIFGLLAFTVRERTRELAIRRALGARVRSIAVLLLQQYTMPLGLGVVTGAAAASLTAVTMRGVTANLGLDATLDPAGFALGLAVFGLALIAAVVPAVRAAARIDATAALRAE